MAVKTIIVNPSEKPMAAKKKRGKKGGRGRKGGAKKAPAKKTTRAKTKSPRKAGLRAGGGKRTSTASPERLALKDANVAAGAALQKVEKLTAENQRLKAEKTMAKGKKGGAKKSTAKKGGAKKSAAKKKASKRPMRVETTTTTTVKKIKNPSLPPVVKEIGKVVGGLAASAAASMGLEKIADKYPAHAKAIKLGGGALLATGGAVALSKIGGASVGVTFGVSQALGTLASANTAFAGVGDIGNMRGASAAMVQGIGALVDRPGVGAIVDHDIGMIAAPARRPLDDEIGALVARYS